MSNLIKGYGTITAKPFVIDSDRSKIGIRLQQEEQLRLARAEAEKKVSEPDADGFSSGIVTSELTDEELLRVKEAQAAEQVSVPEGYETNVEDAHEAALVVNEAYEEAKQIVNEAKAQVEDSISQGFAKGREDGYQQGLQDAENEIQNQKQQMEQELLSQKEQLREDYEAELQKLEPQFADVLCKLLERLTSVVVTGHKDVMMYLINHAMRGIENSHSFVISVSEDDFDYVNKHKEDIYGYMNPGVTIELFQDANLSKNQCKIETESGLCDLSLDVQLSQMIRSLMLLNA